MAVSLILAYNVNSQNVANNTSNVTVHVSVQWTYGSYNKNGKSGWLSIDGTTYNFTSSFNTGQTTSGTQTLFSKTVNVSHNSDGTKKLECAASFVSGVSSGTIAASFVRELPTIPRKSELTVSNGTLGKAQTLTVERKATSFTHTITYKCGSASGTIVEKSSNESVSWTPPAALAKQNTTGTSVSVTLTITTYSGSTTVGSDSKTITCGIPYAPSVSIDVSDATGYSKTYGYGKYIQGLSKIKVVVNAYGVQGSTIKSYSTTADGKTFTAASFTTDPIVRSGGTNVTTTVKDSRGRSASEAVNIQVLPYSAPKISAISANRCDENGVAKSTGAYLAVKFSASITPLSNKNTASYKVEYKKHSENEYTSATLTDFVNQYEVVNGVYVFPAVTSSSYDIRVTATDAFGSATKATPASSIKKLFSIFRTGMGWAFGKIAELEDVLDIAFQTKFTGGILHPVLEPETDLNDVRTPNTYVGANVSTYNYANCPIDSGTFTLEVVGMGDAGQVKQRITSCRKADARAFERIYYTSAWGEWVCVSDYAGALLWSGGYYMTANQTVNLSEPVSKQRSGIVLVFSKYTDGASKNEQFSSFFIPKYLVSNHPGVGHDFKLGGIWNAGAKYLYIHNEQIVGHEKNNQSITVGGITYTNNDFVLRYVIGV